MKRSSRPLAALVISVLAMLSLPLLPGTANASPPQDGVYQIYRPIFSDSTWTVTLASATAVDNTLGVTVIYQNNSASGQGLYCPNTKQSMLVNGQTVTELTSYCAQNVGRIWTVPPQRKFAVWAVFPTLPEQLSAFTLVNWYNWGSVQNIQLIPFVCLIGPGGGCLGVPRHVPRDQMPTPPEWLTSAATGGCVLSLATAGVGGYYAGIYDIWIRGLGGAIRVDEASNKAYVLLNSAIPYRDCREILGNAFLPVAQSLLPAIQGIPFFTQTY